MPRQHTPESPTRLTPSPNRVFPDDEDAGSDKESPENSDGEDDEDESSDGAEDDGEGAGKGMAYRGPSHFISGRLEDLEDPDEDRGEDDEEGSEGSSDEDELSAADVIRYGLAKLLHPLHTPND